MIVSVVIVSFNTKKLTIACIKSVMEKGGKLVKEIIVIDNGSRDNSTVAISKIKNQKSKILIKIIKNKENLGFAKANNQGIRIAMGKYILLLNSDTKVKKGSIGKLIKFAESKKDAGVVVPRILNPDGSIQTSVFNFPTICRAIKQYWLGLGKPLDKFVPATEDLEEDVEVEVGVMAAFLITPLALKKVGLLDERYFMYFEDLDYCRRVLKTELKIYYLPTVEVVHLHGASGVDKSEQIYRLNRSSKIYHGFIKHFIFNFILWSGQKWQKLVH